VRKGSDERIGGTRESHSDKDRPVKPRKDKGDFFFYWFSLFCWSFFEFFPFLNSFFFPFCISSSIVSSLIFSIRSLMLLETRTESSRKESHRSVLVGHYDCLRRPPFRSVLIFPFSFLCLQNRKEKAKGIRDFHPAIFFVQRCWHTPLLCVHISL